jgi:hypothetical protein
MLQSKLQQLLMVQTTIAAVYIGCFSQVSILPLP